MLRGWSSASEADAAARAVADNRTQEMGGWDDAALAEVLEGLAREGDGMLEGVGFDADDLDALLSILEHGPDGQRAKDSRGHNAHTRRLPIDAILTMNSSGGSLCCIAVYSGLKYGTNSMATKPCPRVGVGPFHDVVFVDNEYTDYDHARHVGAVAKYRPKYATVRDVMSREQCQAAGIAHYPLAQILEWAAELERHADNVIVIPKYDCLDNIPERYVLGYSLPSSHGSTPLPVEAFRGRRVHLLGGSWVTTRAALEDLGDDVVSFDNNWVLKVARYGSFVHADGTLGNLDRLGFPAGALTNHLLVALALSCGNIARAVNDLAAGSISVPPLDEALDTSARTTHDLEALPPDLAAFTMVEEEPVA